MTPVRTVFFGSGGFGAPVLRRLAADPTAELVGVVTAPSAPAGRAGGSESVRDVAAGLDVPLLAPVRLRAPDALAGILSLRPGIAILADYGQIVPRPLLDLRFGALNLHPSLLPRHRGATPIPATILADDRETGVTLFRMDEGLDTGPIIATRSLAVPGRVTAPELRALLSAVASELVGASFGPWIRGDVTARPQPAAGVTLTGVLRREDGRLDPDRPAELLDRAVRAYDPWPGTFLETESGRLAVREAGTAPSEPGDEPGTLVAHGDGLALATTDGRLVFAEVRPAGGRAMDGAAYRRGRPGIVGTRVA